MTRQFFRISTAGTAICLALLQLQGCASGNAIDSAVPVSSEVRNTGAYPNINIVPQGQTAQLTDTEVAARKAELFAQADAQRLNGESAEDYIARLRRLQALGSTHAAAALKAIEASQ